MMGVCHREYTLEAVQYHPESILSEGGDELFANFLKLRGGTWRDVYAVGSSKRTNVSVGLAVDSVIQTPSRGLIVYTIRFPERCNYVLYPGLVARRFFALSIRRVPVLRQVWALPISSPTRVMSLA